MGVCETGDAATGDDPGGVPAVGGAWENDGAMVGSGAAVAGAAVLVASMPSRVNSGRNWASFGRGRGPALAAVSMPSRVKSGRNWAGCGRAVATGGGGTALGASVAAAGGGVTMGPPGGHAAVNCCANCRSSLTGSGDLAMNDAASFASGVPPMNFTSASSSFGRSRPDCSITSSSVVAWSFMVAARRCLSLSASTRVPANIIATPSSPCRVGLRLLGFTVTPSKIFISVLLPFVTSSS